MDGNKRVTLRLVGLDKDNGDVRFDDFIKQLGIFKTALSETDRVVSDKTTVYFKVVDLKHNSPALVVLEAVSIKSQEDNSEIVVNKFFGSLDDINKGKIPNGFDYNALQAFKEITSLVEKKRLADVIVSRNGETPQPLNALARKVDDILGPDEFEYGSIVGMLEQINVHANQNVFTIYPKYSRPKLRCVFSQSLRREAIGAVGQYVRVYGQLKFKAHLESKHPYEMSVREMEVYSEGEELPTLASLGGIAPNATGNLSSEDFVKGVRNEW